MKRSSVGIIASIMAVLGVVVTFVIVMFIQSILNGFVLATLWGWFFVPALHVPVLSVGGAIGVSLVVGYMTSKPDTSSDDGDSSKNLVKTIAHGFLYPILALVIGAILHIFV